MPVVPLLEIFGAAWIAEHIIDVAIVCGVSGALAVAAVVWLMHWGNRRDARQRADASIWTVRADVLPPSRTTAVGPAEQPALGVRELHIHLDGTLNSEQAAIIRQALR